MDESSKMNHEKLAYTVAEASELIGVSKSLLYRFIQEGRDLEFPVKRIGGKIIIPRKGLEDYINSNNN